MAESRAGTVNKFVWVPQRQLYRPLSQIVPVPVDVCCLACQLFHVPILGHGGIRSGCSQACLNADLRDDLARPDPGGRGIQRRRPPAGATTARSRRARRGRAGQARCPGRLFDTGHDRKTDARDAHSMAIVAVRRKTLRVLRADGELEALRMLCDRREELTRLRVRP